VVDGVVIKINFSATPAWLRATLTSCRFKAPHSTCTNRWRQCRKGKQGTMKDSKFIDDRLKRGQQAMEKAEKEFSSLTREQLNWTCWTHAKTTCKTFGFSTQLPRCGP